MSILKLVKKNLFRCCEISRVSENDSLVYMSIFVGPEGAFHSLSKNLSEIKFEFELWILLRLKVFEFCHNLSLKVLSQYVYLSFVTIVSFWVIAIWISNCVAIWVECVELKKTCRTVWILKVAWKLDIRTFFFNSLVQSMAAVVSTFMRWLF